MSLAVLATKLFAPPARLDAVDRPALVHSLQTGLYQPGSFALVSAPAGFGKTTILTNLLAGLRQQQRPVAWLSLDAADNDEHRFWTYVGATLDSLAEGVGGAVNGALEAAQAPRGDAIATLLVNEFAVREGAATLVLDDYHVIQEQSIHDGVLVLLENLPPRLSLVIATRVDPPWPLARWRAAGRLVEIRADDLRFTPAEAADFFGQTMELDLDAEQLGMLNRRTEGWVAGLQLAALSLKKSADRSAFLKGFAGSHAYVAEYLMQEVLQSQDEEIHDFLLRTSVLDRMNAGLCEAVTGCDDARPILAALHRNNVFLVPLDDHDEWYRYHHLFADLLRARVNQVLDPQEILTLHVAASLWYERNSLISEAVHHAAAAHDENRVAELIRRSARSTIYAGELNSVREWLHYLPDSTVGGDPELRFLAFWIDVMQNRIGLSQTTIEEMKRSLGDLPSTPENDRLRGEFSAVDCRGVTYSGRVHEGIRLAHTAIARLQADDHASLARVYSALTFGHALDGDRDKAGRAHETMLFHALTAGDIRIAAHTTMIRGRLQADAGYLREATDTFQSILDLVADATEEPRGTEGFPAGLGHIGLGLISLEQNDLSTAEERIQRGYELARRGGLDGTFVARVLLARLRQAQGDLTAAVEELSMLEKVGRRADDFHIAERRIRIALGRGDVDHAWSIAQPYEAALIGEKADGMPHLGFVQLAVMVARVLAARGETAAATGLLNRVEQVATEHSFPRQRLETNLIRASMELKNRSNATNSDGTAELVSALTLGERHGFCRLIVEEGPDLAGPLSGLAGSESLPQSVHSYLSDLLGAFGTAVRPTSAPPLPEGANKGASGLIEPLSPRELEVLHRLASGDSNKEIGEKLFISVRTVKKHTSNIYAKLDTTSRTRAVARARELGLLEP